ncbi:MAG: hypothetical protein IPK64_08875 [bacterium]|nr:hypothetical protein [bacterium]
MKSRVLFALLVAALFVGGCEMDNSNEWQRVVCSVQSINGGTPIVSAALNIGSDPINDTDDYVPLDIVPVLFWARPGNTLMTVPEEGAYSSFIITSYDAVWVPGAGAPDELAEYNITRGLLSARVPINDEFLVLFTVAPQQMKQEPWYPASDSSTAFMANLQLTFYGHEEGSSHEIAIPAGTTVTFVGQVGENN